MVEESEIFLLEGIGPKGNPQLVPYVGVRSATSSEYRVVTKETTLEPGDQLVLDPLNPGIVHRVVKATYKELGSGLV